MESLKALQEEINSHSIKTEKQLEDIELNLQLYVSQYDPAQLSNELDDSNSHSNAEKNIKEVDYFNKLETCNKLWFINGLLNELSSLEMVDTPDWNLISFEGSVNSYTKLSDKVDEFNNNSLNPNDQKVRIVDEINAKRDHYEEKIITLIELLLTEFLEFKEDLSFKYSSLFEDLSFLQFLSLCNLFVQSKSNDSTLLKLFNFNKLFRDWVSDVLAKLDQHFSLEMTKDSGSIGIKFLKSNTEFMSSIKSIETLINFFNEFLQRVSTEDKYNPFSTLKNTIGKEILKSFKKSIFSISNIYPLILDNLNKKESLEDQSIIKELLKISTLLSQPGWSSDGICDLEFWIDDLSNYWIKDLVDQSIDEIKGICTDLKVKNPIYGSIFEILLKNELPDEGDELPVSDELPSVNIKQNNYTLQIQQEQDDTWNDKWDDDDGWGDNASVKEAKPEPESKSKVRPNQLEDDGWGAWNNDDEDDWDLDEPKVKPKPISKAKPNLKITNSTKPKEVPVKRFYKYSKLAPMIVNTVTKFYYNFTTLKNKVSSNVDEIESIDYAFKSNFKKLFMCYFMIIQPSVLDFYPSKILFYNDFNKILEDVSSMYTVDLKSCFDLNLSLAQTTTNEYSQQLLAIVKPYDPVLFNDNTIDDLYRIDKSNEFVTELDKFFSNLETELFSEIDINRQLIMNILTSLITNLYSYISYKTINRTEIGSEESQLLGNMIEKVFEVVLRDQDLTLQVRKTTAHQKLSQVQLVLTSRLRGILDHFYDARFYNLETEELVSLIKSLFIDSSMRKNAIDEIHSIRNGGD